MITGAFTTAVFADDFPDPVVVKVCSTFYAYATGSAGRNLSVMASTDLEDWGDVADPLPVLPSWAGPGRTWAPSVAPNGAELVMYYTVRHAASGRQCISRATASSPEGPFVDDSAEPAIFQSERGGSIDPEIAVDAEGGGDVLVWKSDDNAIGRPTCLWGHRLSADGLLQAGSPTLLLGQSEEWQAPRVEGPAVVAHDGTCYLFYGANDYETARSGIGYATAPALLGPYTNQSARGPWLGSRGHAQGPQGPAVFVDGAGELRMAFAAWQGTVGYRAGGVRSLWIGSLGFSADGEPTLHVP